MVWCAQRWSLATPASRSSKTTLKWSRFRPVGSKARSGSRRAPGGERELSEADERRVLLKLVEGDVSQREDRDPIDPVHDVHAPRVGAQHLDIEGSPTHHDRRLVVEPVTDPDVPLLHPPMLSRNRLSRRAPCQVARESRERGASDGAADQFDVRVGMRHVRDVSRAPILRRCAVGIDSSFSRRGRCGGRAGRRTRRAIRRA